jgi:hypothetical protein
MSTFEIKAVNPFSIFCATSGVFKTQNEIGAIASIYCFVSMNMSNV